MKLETSSKPPVIWSPLKGSQALAISCPCNHILYEGTRGPGKTDAQLLYFRQHVGKGYGQFWRGVIFDKKYKNLDDLIAKSKRWFPQFNDGARWLASGSSYKWVWPTGEELLFRQMSSEDDYWNYHGQEFPYIGWNELTKQADSNLYDMMMSCNRSSFLPDRHSPINEATGERELLPEMPLVVFSTSNPYGIGHNWVKLRFIDPAPAGIVVKITSNVFNPRTQQKEDITKTQVRIFGSYKENTFLAPEYILELENITDPNKRAAWLWGDWDITSGGMFDDIWSSTENKVKPFRIPNNWRMFRSFDWGSSHPFSVGWWAESDGSDVLLPDGTWKSTVRGDVFRIDEWYGWTGKANTGLRMLATKVSQGIISREIAMGYHGRIKAGPADGSIYDVQNGMCIGNDMAKSVIIKGHKYRGAIFTRAIKSPGSRINGWELMRIAMDNGQRPENNGPRESPGLFVFDNCKQFLRTVPSIPRDDVEMDDVNTDAEDHIADESRYVILSLGDRFKTKSTIGLY